MTLTSFPFLSFLMAIPLIGALFLSAISTQMEQTNAKKVGLWCSGLCFFLCALMGFWIKDTGFSFEEIYRLYGGASLSYHVGVSSFNYPFLLLTTLLTPLCLLMGWGHPIRDAKLYTAMFLILESLLMGAFSSLNLLMFYVFFEATLIPMFFLIGLWGGEQRFYATFKFMIYAAAGSILMLIGIAALYNLLGTFDRGSLLTHALDSTTQLWIWGAFLLAFAVKLPLWPFHTWLPDAHVQAPTGASMMLAGVLLKLGGFGILFWVIPLFPQISAQYGPHLFPLAGLSLVGISLVVFAQRHMKRLVAYASVAHMATVVFGAFSQSTYGLLGSTIQMISHGLSSAALFLCVGILYRKYGSYKMKDYGGLFALMPWWSFFFFLACLSTLGLPGTSGFVGEFLVILGLFEGFPFWSIVVASGFILSAAYILKACAALLFGKGHLPQDKSPSDIDRGEAITLSILSLCILLLGLWPQPLASSITKPLAALSTVIKGASHDL